MTNKVEQQELIETISALDRGMNGLLNLIPDIGQRELDTAYAALDRAKGVLARLETPSDGGARQDVAQQT